MTATLNHDGRRVRIDVCCRPPRAPIWDTHSARGELRSPSALAYRSAHMVTGDQRNVFAPTTATAPRDGDVAGLRGAYEVCRGDALTRRARVGSRPSVSAATARSRRGVCRGPLIRLPSGAIGVRWRRVVAQAARGALRGRCCVRRLDGGRSPWSCCEVADTRQCAARCAAAGQLAPRLTAQLTGNRHRPVTRPPSAVPTDPAQCPQTRVSLIFDAVVLRL